MNFLPVPSAKNYEVFNNYMDLAIEFLLTNTFKFYALRHRKEFFVQPEHDNDIAIKESSLQTFVVAMLGKTQANFQVVMSYICERGVHKI